MVVLGVFVVYPFIRAVHLGSQRCDIQGRSCVSNGWDQYWDVFRSVEFQRALWVTVRFAVLTVPTGTVIGLGLALLAHRRLRGVAVYRFVLSSTVATSAAVASSMWLFLLQPEVGVLSNVGWLADTFPVLKRPGLLRDPATALVAVSASSVWSGLGFTFIVVSAGLRSIPDELYEAAAIDGAAGMVKVWRITLPMLGPNLSFVAIVLTTRSFQAYAEIDLLTKGGPRPGDSTTTLMYLTYGDDSVLNGAVGLQAASGVLLFGLLVGLTALQLWSMERRMRRGS
jgi:ABC-type sugar transport system permease subunit